MPLVINGQRIDDAVLNGEFANIKSYFESLGNVGTATMFCSVGAR